MHQGWVYVVRIMDLDSRRIVGLAIDSHIENALVEHALHRALPECCPRPLRCYTLLTEAVSIQAGIIPPCYTQVR